MPTRDLKIGTAKIFARKSVGIHFLFENSEMATVYTALLDLLSDFQCGSF